MGVPRASQSMSGTQSGEEVRWHIGLHTRSRHCIFADPVVDLPFIAFDECALNLNLFKLRCYLRCFTTLIPYASFIEFFFRYQKITDAIDRVCCCCLLHAR